MFSHIKQLNIILLYLNYCIRFLFYLDSVLEEMEQWLVVKRIIFLRYETSIRTEMSPPCGWINKSWMSFSLLLAKYDDDEPL